jgi:O-antigen ligase
MVRAAAAEALRTAGRPALVQRILRAVCVLLGASAPLCLLLGVRGFAPVIGACGLLCLPWARPAQRDWPGVWILAGLVAWAGISLAWSPAPNLRPPQTAAALGRFTIAHLAALLVLCTALVTGLERLEPRRADKALGWIACGFLLAPPLLVEEALNHQWLYQALPALIHQQVRVDKAVARLAQGGYVIAVVAWPLGVALHRRKRLWLALALAAFVPLSMLLLRGVAATVTLAASLPVFYLALRRGRTAIRAFAAITAAYLLATPLVMFAVDHLGLYLRLKGGLWPSWSDRLRIWSFVVEQFAARPLRGAGLDASRAFPGVVPLHPHNGPLQLWFELGLPGAVLGTMFWLWLWRRIERCARRDPVHGAAAAATAMVYLGISSVSFGLWQDWWLCVGAFALALCLLLGKALRGDAGGETGARSEG